MSNRRILVSPEARNRLAELYTAYLDGAIAEADYRRILDWFDQSVVSALAHGAFAEFGESSTRLYGLLQVPEKRFLAATHLARNIRVTVLDKPDMEEIVVAEIAFDPPFGA